MKNPRAPWIPLKDCENGWLYRIRSRNLLLGVFRRSSKGFVGIREKFGYSYLFEEYHYEIGPPLGTVFPLKKIERCPVKDTRCNIGTKCDRCKRPVTYICGETPSGEWTHDDGREGHEILPVSVQNKKLFQYLDLAAFKFV